MYPNGEKEIMDIYVSKRWKRNYGHLCIQTLKKLTITKSFPVKLISAVDKANLQLSPLSKFNCKDVLCDNDLQSRYVTDVYNRYEALSEKMTEPLTDDRYEALIIANAEEAKNIQPKKRKRKGIDFETAGLIHAKNLLKSCTIKNRMKSTRVLEQIFSLRKNH